MKTLFSLIVLMISTFINASVIEINPTQNLRRVEVAVVDTIYHEHVSLIQRVFQKGKSSFHSVYHYGGSRTVSQMCNDVLIAGFVGGAVCLLAFGGITYVYYVYLVLSHRFSVFTTPTSQFDHFHNTIKSIQRHPDAIDHSSLYGDTINHFFLQNLNVTNLLFTVAGHILFKRGDISRDFFNLQNQIDVFFNASTSRKNLYKVKTFHSHFCFYDDQNFTVETQTQKSKMHPPLFQCNVTFLKSCDGTEVILSKWLHLLNPRTMEISVSTPYMRLMYEINQPSTQRRLLGEDPNEPYLFKAQNEFMKKSALGDLLLVFVDKLNNRKCPSNDLIDNLNALAFSLRWVVPYLSTDYVAFRIWFSHNGYIRNVIAAAVDEIPYDNNDESSFCHFQSNETLGDENAILYLAIRHIYRFVTRPLDFTMTRDLTLTKRITPSWTHPFDVKNSASDSSSQQYSPSITTAETVTVTAPTPSKSLLSQEQYYDLLERGVWLNESNAYLKSVFPEIASLSYQESWGRWSDQRLSLKGTNFTFFKTLYPLPKQFVMTLFGRALNNNAGQMMNIFITNHTDNVPLKSSGAIYTGNYCGTFSDPAFNQTAFIRHNVTNANYLVFDIPYPQSIRTDYRKLGIGFILLKLFKSNSAIEPIYSREEYFEILKNGITFDNKSTDLDTVFSTNGTILNQADMSSIFPKISGLSCIRDFEGRWSDSEATLDGTNMTRFEFLYPLPKKFILRLIGGSYGNNVEQIMNFYVTNSFVNKNLSQEILGTLYTGDYINKYSSYGQFDNSSLVITRGEFDSIISFDIPSPEKHNNLVRKLGIFFQKLQIISLDSSTISPSRTPLSQEQYYDLLERGVWFNESDAYLDSIFPEITGLSVKETNGRWSDAEISSDHSNLTMFTLLYPFKGIFNLSFYGAARQISVNHSMDIYFLNNQNITENNILEPKGFINISSIGVTQYAPITITTNNETRSVIAFKTPSHLNEPTAEGKRLSSVFFSLLKFIKLA